MSFANYMMNFGILAGFYAGAMVLLRLLCPFSPESRLSVMPEQERITVNLYTPEELTAPPL